MIKGFIVIAAAFLVLPYPVLAQSKAALCAQYKQSFQPSVLRIEAAMAARNESALRASINELEDSLAGVRAYCSSGDSNVLTNQYILLMKRVNQTVSNW